MAFWSDRATEPNRSYRWVITFGGLASGLDNAAFALKTCKKPSFKLKTTEHWYLNHKFNYPGRVEWEDIDITFASITNPNVAGVLYTLFRSAGYVFPTNNTVEAGGLQTISKFDATAHLGNLALKQIDANGKSTEIWTLKNPFFTDINFGDLSYDDEKIVEVKCTIKYDAAELVTFDAAPRIV